MNSIMIGFMPRIASLVIGYFFGCLLTGEFVVRLKTKKSASEFGSGNPGMANVMRVFGFRTGIIVLIGDLLKTIAACLLCLFLFSGNRLSDPHLAIGQIAVLWAGLGAVLGHNWPFWRNFSGGKGVAVTCMAIFLFSPLWGLISDAAGMMVVLTTGYLPLGAVVITTLFTILCYLFCSKEAAILALILALIMFSRHWRGLIRVITGKEKRNAQYLKFSRSSRKTPEASGGISSEEASNEMSQEVSRAVNQMSAQSGPQNTSHMSAQSGPQNTSHMSARPDSQNENTSHMSE